MITVILVPAAMPDRNGVQKHFVEIKGVPHSHGGGALIVTMALELAAAEQVKREIEDALDEYRRPKRVSGKKRPKTSWERITKDE